jgi:hypothetical protein
LAELTKRERVLRTIRFEETDRIPLYDLIQNDAIIEHYAGRPLTVEDGDRTACLAIGRILDMTRSAGGPSREGETVHPDGTVTRHERWTSWIEKRPFHDLPGLVEWVKNEICRLNGLEFDRAYARETHAFVQRRLDLFAEAEPTGRGDPAVYVLESGVGLTEMYHAAGMDWFALLLAEEPALVEEWFDARNRAELRRVAAIADPALMPVALPYDDLAYKNGPLFSPDWLRAVWMPRLKKLVDAWHSRDTYCLFHSDGDLWLILDDLVAAGIDGLNPLEVMAGMSVGKVRERYPKLFLTGGIDVSQLLTHGTPDEVRTACRQAIEEAQGRGYFLGSTTEIHWSVPLENAQAMFETAWGTAVPAPHGP